MLALDHAVPHRDALLDSRLVAGALSGSLVPGPVSVCRRAYVKYRFGEGLRVVYRVEAEGGVHHVAARGFGRGASEDGYRRALATAVPAAPLRPVVHVPELDAVFWGFPNDRRLTTLPLLAGRSDTLDRLVGLPRLTPRLVAYCAERSASAECVDESGRVVAFAKVHAGDGAEHERRRLDAAQAVAGDGLRVPRVIGASAIDGALALEAVGGRRLDTLESTELRGGLERLGAALAALHARSPLPERPFTRLDVERLANAVGVIARARPDAGHPAAELLARLLRHRDAGDGPAVCVHGDVNLRNAMLDGDAVTLIDFEDAAAGPAAADLGQVLAALRWERVGGGISETAERALGHALVAGYATGRRPPGERALRWHTAACVLARLALPAVTRVRAPMLRRLGALLEAA
jgi:aminoglycoside phosphotransferase